MAYGKIKADTLVYDNSGSDVETSISSLAAKANLPASAGTVAASEVVQVDANKDTTGIRNLTISGNLQVNGTTTTVASSTMTVTDKNIEIAKGAANDAAADGGGITLESGDGNKEIKWINSTDSWTFNQDIEVTSGGVKITGAEGGNATLSLNADEADDNADQWRVMAGSGGALTIGSYSTGSWINTLTIDGSGIVTGHSNVVAGGTVSDSKGNLRSIPQITSLSSAHTLATGDTGKHILTNSQTIIIPNSTFAAGDAITLVNNGSSATTLTKSITNLYNPADGTTPTALAAKGMCTILFVSGTEAYISGAGLS